MGDLNIWVTLGIICIAFSILSRISVHKKNWRFMLWAFEIWRDFISYFTAAIIGYFFIDVRWPLIHQSGNLSINDFILFIVFLFAVLGWLPYVFKSVTEGIERILEKIIK